MDLNPGAYELLHPHPNHTDQYSKAPRKHKKCVSVLLLLCPAILCLSAFSGIQSGNIGAFPFKMKSKEKEEKKVAASPVRINELFVQSAGVAVGAFFLKRGYRELKRAIEARRATSTLTVTNLTEASQEEKSVTGLEKLGMDMGRLFQTESLLCERDITSNFTILGSGFDSTGCCGATLSVQVIGKKKSLLREDSDQTVANVQELFSSTDPVIVAMQVKKPMKKRAMISKIEKGLTSSYERGERREVNRMVRKLREKLKETLPSTIISGRTIRFDILPTANSKMALVNGTLGTEPVVEILLENTSLAMIQSKIFMHQLLNMVVGPRPLSQSVKESIGESAVEALKAAMNSGNEEGEGEVPQTEAEGEDNDDGIVEEISTADEGNAAEET